MDREQRDQLTALVDQANALEDLARKVQAEEDEQAAVQHLRVVEHDYLTWQSTAIHLLPDDLKDQFTFEYEGNFAQFRIRHFLRSGRQESRLWAVSDEAGRRFLDKWQYTFNDAFRGPLLAQKKMLLEAASRFGASGETINALDLLVKVSRKLPFAIATLGRPVRERRGININDEYDLQRLVHAILQLHFDDVREEEYSPSSAGSGTRIDFVLSEARVAVETKMTRVNLKARQLGDELAADILRYRKHPDVGALIALVYDPQRIITNPTGFERDLLSDDDQFMTRAVIIQ